MGSNPWTPGNNGTGKRIWFVVRQRMTNVATDYHYGKGGTLVRYGSHEAALRAAERLNRGVA